MDKDQCVAMLSTARVCGRSLSGMAGSNPAKGMDSVSCGLARRADHLGKGVLTSRPWPKRAVATRKNTEN
jgi:hypothetical protein